MNADKKTVDSLTVSDLLKHRAIDVDAERRLP